MPTLLRQTNALLLQVVEQIADGVLLTDRHGFIEPGASVVRALMTEKGMSLFTASRHFAEFKLVAYTGTANLT